MEAKLITQNLVISLNLYKNWLVEKAGLKIGKKITKKTVFKNSNARFQSFGLCF